MPFYDSPAFGGEAITETINGIKIHRAVRGTCIVCGHPTGDCTGDSKSINGVQPFSETLSLERSVMFMVEQDYFESREIITGVNIKKLIYKKGTMIPLRVAQELGLLK